MSINELLKKKVEDLTEKEKEFLKKHEEDLSDKAKKKFAEVFDEKEDEDEDEEGDEEEGEGEGEEGDEDEDEDGIDKKSLVKLLDKNIDARMEKKFDKISERLVSKFFAGVAESRKKIFENETMTEDEKKISKSKAADKKTREFMQALINKDYARAKAISTTTDGVSPNDANAGITIPTELLAEVLRFLPTYGICRRDMRYLPFSSPGNTRTIPALAASVKLFWTGEGAKKKSSQPKFSLVTQTLKKLAAICPLTEEILEDTAIPLTSLIGELFAEAIGVEEDAQFLAGTGAPWTGVLNNGLVNVCYQITAGTANVTADDLLNMKKGVPTSALPGCKYYFNPETEILLQQLKDKNGRYILQNPTDEAPGRLWGKPYELTDVLPTPDSVEEGDPWIIFGNLKKSCILGDKQRIRVKMLEEATITDTDDQTEINLGEQDMMAMRIVERVGYVCALPTGITVLKNEVESGSSES
jgi:HK97 family phage major capsid protein